MSKAFKIVLMVCGIVLVLAVSGSMIYYYVIFRPGIERAEVKLQEQKLELEKKEMEKKAAEEAPGKENLERCLTETEDWYNEAKLERLGKGGLSDAEIIIILTTLNNMRDDKIDACNKKYGK